MLFVYIYYLNVKSNENAIKKKLKEQEYKLIKYVENYNRFVDGFDNFFKQKIYTTGLGFLSLKKYQEDLIEVLDPILDSEMIASLQISNIEIENLLKELSFISKNTIRFRKENKSSIINEIYFDESKFSKN